MRGAIVVLAAGLVAGCASQLEIPKEVDMPVAAACVDPKDVPPAPRIRTEAELRAMPEYSRTLQLWVDHWLLVSYKEKLEAIASSCSKIPELKPAGGLGLRPR